MENNSQSRDDEIPLKDLPKSANLTSEQKLKETKAQVDEVVGIMRINVEKVLERDQHLNDLNARAEILSMNASKFETQSARLRRKSWWRNVKMMIVLVVIGFCIFLAIIFWLIDFVSSEDQNSNVTKKPT